MNLRGEVLTLVDVRPALKMPVSMMQKKGVIVLDHSGLVAGVVVGEICEVIHLDPARITSRVSTATAVMSGYWSGTATYGNHILTILDLPKLLESGELVVNEEV